MKMIDKIFNKEPHWKLSQGSPVYYAIVDSIQKAARSTTTPSFMGADATSCFQLVGVICLTSSFRKGNKTCLDVLMFSVINCALRASCRTQSAQVLMLNRASFV
jgi:hypothetical protein